MWTGSADGKGVPAAIRGDPRRRLPPMSDRDRPTPPSAELPAASHPRSVAEIEAEIAVARDNLVSTVGQLQVAVKVAVDPRRLVQRQLDRVRLFYVDEYGGVRPERVAVTVGVVVTVVMVRRVATRGRRRRAIG